MKITTTEDEVHLKEDLLLRTREGFKGLEVGPCRWVKRRTKLGTFHPIGEFAVDDPIYFRKTPTLDTKRGCHGFDPDSSMARSDEAQWWFHAVYEAVQEIPPGTVTSYGHIARLLGRREYNQPTVIHCMLTGLCSSGMPSVSGIRARPHSRSTQRLKAGRRLPQAPPRILR